MVEDGFCGGPKGVHGAEPSKEFAVLTITAWAVMITCKADPPKHTGIRP
jgi:hypothetical protein